MGSSSSSWVSSAHTHVLSRLIQALHTLTQPQEIAQAALAVFQEAFPPSLLALYQAQPARSILRLLALVTTEESADLPMSRTISYETPSLLKRALREQAPILIPNLSASDTALSAALDIDEYYPKDYGCLCLPLWHGTVFEGCFLALVPAPDTFDAVDAEALNSCALYLAQTLSSARMRQAAEEERLRQRAILDQLPEGIVITESASGRVSYANKVAARLLDIALDELIGSILSASTHATFQSTEYGWPHIPWTFAIVRALSGEMVHQMEASVTRADGSRISVLCSSSPLRGELRTISGAILVFQDITEQKQLEAQKQLFFSCASHELRTPLTAVMGYAELLREVTTIPEQETFDLPTLRHASQQICVQTEQMMYLIDEMLDLSRLDEGSLALQRTAIDLLALTRRVVEHLTFTTHIHQFQLVPDAWQSAEAGVMVLADNFHLARVLNILLTNALKYSPAGGEIEVGIRKDTPSTHYAQFWVKDHGVGIAADDLPHLFTRFYRARTLDRAISGLGIGLYLAKQVIELHGGQLWVESTIGQGSTFYFSLPLLPDDEQ